ncbi:MAG TPA: MBL fold metallo-hydrolase [Hyphomicrobium sp.]|nr:MBL fold metallo-hydrolase [Hyphomicrobium sp.]
MPDSQVILRFCGAAKTVTGACFWLRSGEANFLVDCGLFQGSKTLKELNYRPFPFDPGQIDFVLLTHAHIDHAGLLPRLIKEGFKGPVYMTQGSKDLLTFMLPDSGHIQEIEVEHLNERNRQWGVPDVEPIYTRRDAEGAIERFKTVAYETWIEPVEGVRARFWNAGHILGSASIELELSCGREQRILRMLFSGDIGPEHKLFHADPKAPENFDYVVMESTYGGRTRTKATPDHRRMLLAEEIKQALRADGVLLIPSFAVERTQELLCDIIRLQESGAIPRMPVFLDSPLAVQITKVFESHIEELEDLGGRKSLLRNPAIVPTITADESKRINRITASAIIMAASGMCEAGRIRHHLKHWLWRPDATVLLAGFQAQGTLGRLLADGASAVTIQGTEIAVRAKIRQTDLYSGHADRDELVEWLRGRQPIKRAVYLVHGEDDDIEALRDSIASAGLDKSRIIAPVLDDEVELTGEGTLPRERAAPRRLDPAVVGRPDWHNELAQIFLDIKSELDKAADDRSRNIILRRLRRALEGADG